MAGYFLDFLHCLHIVENSGPLHMAGNVDDLLGNIEGLRYIAGNDEEVFHIVVKPILVVVHMAL